MGLLEVWDGVFVRIKRNDKVHLAWCVTGVIACLVLYGVLQVWGCGACGPIRNSVQAAAPAPAGDPAALHRL